MQQIKLSICFYPTTIVLVDDNKEYLKQIMLRFSGREKFACLSYDNPQKALEFLTIEYKADPFINRCFQKIEDSPTDHVDVSLNVRAIHQEIYNPFRFNQVSILIIDYAMPGINGLELCRQLKGTSIKIIMLTGEAGKDLAVEAFNEGSIDKFILKNTPDLMGILVHTIRELQMSYFLNFSERALNKIAHFSANTLVCLDDPIFISFFHQLCEEKQIREYYLMDDLGSFLMLDADGNPHWLAVANDEMMDTYYEFAEGDNAPQSMVQALKNKQMIPYFYTESDFQMRPQKWQPYLHPASILEGKERYYYAFIENSTTYAFPSKKILSYEQFLKKIEN
jgi:CheY-like chemotaxis protein